MQHIIQNNFDINPNKRIVDSPFFLSSTKSWDIRQLLINNTKSMDLMKVKTRMMTDNYPTKKHRIFIIDGDYEVEYIDPEYLKTKYIEFFKKEPEQLDVKDMLRGLEKLPLTDRQRQVFMSVCRGFKMFEGGIIEPLEHNGLNLDIVGGELEGFLVYALRMDFKTYYKITRLRPEAIEQIRRALTDIVTKKFIDNGYINPMLPNQYIPILAFQSMKDNHGNPMVLSLRQAYTLFNYLDRKTQWNFVATDRQSGKTFLTAGIAFIELLKPQGNDVVYVVVDENAFEQPFTYFKRLSAEAERFGVFEFKESQKKAYCPLTGNKIIFVLGGSKMGIRGKSGRVFIFDEAGFIKDNTFKDGIPTILSNEASLRALSTINREGNKDQTEWFYNYLIMSETVGGVEIEVEGEPHLFPAQGIRVTVDDVEWKSAVAIAMQKQALKDDPDRYYAELYATLSTGENSIMPKGFFISKVGSDMDDEFICAYDPAKKKDTGGLLAFNMTKGIYVDEARMQNMSYMDQIRFIRDRHTVYKFKEVLLDRTGVGEAVYELAPDLFTMGFVYTSGNETREKFQGCKVYYVPQKFLVDAFITLAEEQKIQALMTLKMFAGELSLFGSKKKKSGGSKYEALSGTDDIVNAALMTAWLYGKRIKYENFMKERQKQKDKRNLDREIESPTNSMNIYIKRLGHENGIRGFGI